MNRTGLLVGLTALVLIGTLGYFWFNRAEPVAPTAVQVELAESPETVAVPEPEPALTPQTEPELAPQTEPESVPSPVISQAPKPAPEPQAAPAPAKAEPPVAEDTKSVSAASVESAVSDRSAEKVPEPAPRQDNRDVIARLAPPEPAPAVQAIEAPAAAKPKVKTRQVAPPRDTGPVAIPPSFDVVRVEPSGEAVVAGRAAPGSTVRLIDGSQALAEVLTNNNGEWVIVLRVPLAPGAHELGLESHLISGEILLSENVVVVNVPAPALVAKIQPPPAAAPASEATETTSEAAETSASSGSPDPVRASADQPLPARAGAGQPEPARASAGQPIETVRPLAVLMARRGTGPSRIIQAPEPVPSNLGDKALLLETVDYDDRGRAVIGGRGATGVVLLLYLDNRPAGRTLIGADGRWRAYLEGEVPFGVHSLRVDQVSKTGKVVARVESPFSRASLVAAADDETAVIVQPGNSLWRIARRVYGEGLRYSVIYTANRNQIGDPDLIYPGQIFVVPAN